MSAISTIPVKNIYYLLCYAWDKLDEGKTIAVDTEDSKTLLDLFARVLINGTTYLFKKGLERNYLPHHEQVTGIRGKWDITNTIKRQTHLLGRTYCHFDEFSYNTIHNQILKTTIYRLLKTEQLDKENYQDLLRLYQRFHEVQTIHLSIAAFNTIRLHRNNQYYDLLLKICRLIFDNSFLTEEDGNFQFKDFIRDERQMHGLFETFVKQFYKKKLSKIFKVHSPHIKWQFSTSDGHSKQFFPIMKTDTVLEAKDKSRKIIIDTKFYKEALQYNYNTGKAKSTHLYQIFAYLLNSRNGEPMNENAEGILLYPQVKAPIRLQFKYQNHSIKVWTIDLNQPWQSLERELMEMVSI